MNRYSVSIGYSCNSYGNLSGYVYANSREEAEELICETDNIHDQDFETNDSDNYNYYDAEADIDLVETDILPPHNNDNSNSNTPFSNTPNYYLAELNVL